MPTRLRPLLTALVLVALLAPACSHDSTPRSVLTIMSVNGDEAVKSDVARIDPVQGLVLVEDQAEVDVRNAPADGTLEISASGPYGYVTIDSYEVAFESTEEIPTVHGSLGWTVTTGQTLDGILTIVPVSLKMEPVLVGLRSGGEILATAHITLFGHEATSGQAVTAEGTVPVHFANWVDP